MTSHSIESDTTKIFTIILITIIPIDDTPTSVTFHFATPNEFASARLIDDSAYRLVASSTT